MKYQKSHIPNFIRTFALSCKKAHVQMHLSHYAPKQRVCTGVVWWRGKGSDDNTGLDGFSRIFLWTSKQVNGWTVFTRSQNINPNN